MRVGRSASTKCLQCRTVRTFQRSSGRAVTSVWRDRLQAFGCSGRRVDGSIDERPEPCVGRLRPRRLQLSHDRRPKTWVRSLLAALSGRPSPPVKHYHFTISLLRPIRALTFCCIYHTTLGPACLSILLDRWSEPFTFPPTSESSVNFYISMQ